MSEEEDIISRKLLLFILINAFATFLIGLVLLLLGYNIYFNELFYDNQVTYITFSIITYLGDVIPSVLIVTTAYYIYDKRFAKNLAYSLLSSSYSNGVLKDIFQDPRPWTRREVTGYGFPSGHSQNAVAVWGYMAYHARKKNKIVAWIFVFIAYLIAISRVMVGVHDIQDIWGGLLFGMLFLTIFILLEPRASEIINSLHIALKLLLAIIIPVILFLAVMLIFPETEIEYGIYCGAMLGISCGYLVECKFIQYDPTELEGKERIINLIIGVIITFVLYFILSLVDIESQIWDFAQFTILSFLLVTLVPWIFTVFQAESHVL
ncbi:MAG: phosphatase PAP2 family protein [Candidatus Lokiarchaeota archaeon]|nr:phosphatase PAP2 family protein [Candidatus Lokiarchaeota archaeon]